jgi:hypothetical protein
MRADDSPEPVSFASGVTDSACPIEPLMTSTEGLGATGELIVADIVDDPHVVEGVPGAHVPVTELHTTYDTGVAAPLNVVNGTNVTDPADRVQVPSPEATTLNFVQPVDRVSPVPHSLSVDESRLTLP